MSIRRRAGCILFIITLVLVIVNFIFLYISCIVVEAQLLIKVKDDTLVIIIFSLAYV